MSGQEHVIDVRYFTLYCMASCPKAAAQENKRVETVSAATLFILKILPSGGRTHAARTRHTSSLARPTEAVHNRTMWPMYYTRRAGNKNVSRSYPHLFRQM
jgi:hypothetical protein